MSEIYKLSWEETYERIIELQNEIYKTIGEYKVLKMYGIPKGGAILASVFTKFSWIKLVFKPEEADIFIDDIIDSGRTKQKFEKYNKPFFALIDKLNKEEHRKLGWILFPWESDKIDDVDDNITRICQFYNLDLKYLDSLKSHIKYFIEKSKQNS